MKGPLEDGDVARFRRNGFAVAAMVLGIVGAGIAWLPFVFVIGVVAAALGLAEGAIRVDGPRRADGPAGLLAPGVRVAWTIAAPELIRAMVLMRQGEDLCTSTVTQALVAADADVYAVRDGRCTPLGLEVEVLAVVHRLDPAWISP